MADDAQPNQDMPLEWTAHPVREQPLKSFVVSLVVMGCGQLVALSVLTGMAKPSVLVGVLAGVGAMLFLFFMLNRFYLPSSYRLDENGIAVRYPVGKRSLRWRDLRRFSHDDTGGYLSTRLKGGAFDSRGISVFFAGRGDEIIPRIKAAMQSTREQDA